MASPPSQSPPARGTMSLYANLLEADSSASISRDPVLFKDNKDAASSDPKKPPLNNPALRFQPIRRPQVKAPAKPKPAFPKAPAAVAPSSSTTATSTPSTSAAAPAPPRSTLADWAATEDDEYFYGYAGEKRQRGGRRKKKKKQFDEVRETDWDELYDPSRPTNVEEYLRSEERVREVREWKAILYAHRRRRDTDEAGSEGEEDGGMRDERFAPPPSLTFAPPPMSPPRAAASAVAAAVMTDATGDDAYARRLALSGMALPPPPPPPPTDSATTISRAPVRYSPPPPPPPDDKMDLDEKEDDYDPEVDYSAIPLPPPAPTEADDGRTDQRSTRPAQKGKAFAQRLMAKYGWTRGSGLGANGSGITTALRVQVERRTRRPDAEGGGFAEPGGRGRIIAPKMPKAKAPQQQEGSAEGSEAPAAGEGKFGRTSVVVVLDRMLDNMPDVEAEVEAGLGQEIGEECGERYGRVERIVVDVEGRRVFIKFVEAVSALRVSFFSCFVTPCFSLPYPVWYHVRLIKGASPTKMLTLPRLQAVSALQGRIFNGNAIAARFYDEDKFEEGIYDG
ncbi:hypothetical protein VTJ49DRAFT_5922 [Mycothermus thermophilus]|uniref:G-patch domain-containing protein n=1 Tax=Humicola insolens TaxID=85995 RepID=A0ABR3VK14_HUMIN